MCSTIPKEIKKLLKDFDDPIELKYEIISQLRNGIAEQQIIEDLKNKKIGFESSQFSDFHSQKKLKNSQIENPVEMKEGEIECPKCKKKKTIVLELQTRSCDEGFTYELHCFNQDCKYIKRNF